MGFNKRYPYLNNFTLNVFPLPFEHDIVSSFHRIAPRMAWYVQSDPNNYDHASPENNWRLFEQIEKQNRNKIIKNYLLYLKRKQFKKVKAECLQIFGESPSFQDKGE